MAFGDLLQSTKQLIGGSGHSVAKAFASNVQAGSLLVCGIYAGGNGLTFSVVDDMGAGNVWAQGIYKDQTTDSHAVAVWAAIAKAGGACQITGSFTGAADNIDVQIIIAEYEGPWASSSILDATASAQSTGSTSVSSGASVIATNQSELCIAMVGGSGVGTTCTGSNGYTVRQTGVNNGANFQCALMDKLDTIGGVQTATATLGSSNVWSVALATYRKSIQASKPTATPTPGTWIDAGSGTNLHLSLDETSPDDSDYATNFTFPFFLGGGGVESFAVTMESMTDPASSIGHFLHYRYFLFGYNGSDVQLTVSLLCGATFIVGSSVDLFADTGIVVAGTIALSNAQADAITDYSQLKVTVDVQDVSNSASGGEFRVTWIRFETPAVAAVSTPGTKKAGRRRRRRIIDDDGYFNDLSVTQWFRKPELRAPCL
jgi:hypothetical protein